eukprot:Awhi_evm2s15009
MTMPEGFPATLAFNSSLHIDWILRIKVYLTLPGSSLPISKVASRLFLRKGTLYLQDDSLIPRFQAVKYSHFENYFLFKERIIEPEDSRLVVDAALSKNVYKRAEPINVKCQFMNT